MLVAGSALDGSSMGRDVVIIRPWLLLWVEVLAVFNRRASLDHYCRWDCDRTNRISPRRAIRKGNVR